MYGGGGEAAKASYVSWQGNGSNRRNWGTHGGRKQNERAMEGKRKVKDGAPHGCRVGVDNIALTLSFAFLCFVFFD